MKLVAEEAGKTFAIGGTATGWSTSWSMLLIGVGHLVGISVGAAMFFGMIISVDGARAVARLAASFCRRRRSGRRHVPRAGALHRRGHDRRRGDLVPAQDHRPDHRRAALGAGGIACAHRGRDARPDRARLPIGIVALVIVAMLVPIAWLLWSFSAGGPVRTIIPSR
jgi:hypothetical protein